MSVYDFVEKNSLHHVKNLKGKKVLLRLDLNVPLGSNECVDPGEDWRILKSLKTISYLREEGASVIIISHIGRKKDLSLRPVFEYMKQFFTLGFVPSYETELLESLMSDMKEGSVLMLENLRQFEGELDNYARYLEPITRLCDLFVNEAFAVSHRNHASVCAVTKMLPSYFGFHFVEEIKHLSFFLHESQGVKTLVLGGAKFGTKLPLLEKLLPRLDYVLLGGALANLFLKERGFNIGSSYYDDSVTIESLVENNKILVPIDFVDQDGDIADISEVRDEDSILDLGPKTTELFETIIDASSVVLWNGPLGKYEDGFTESSLRLADSIAHSGAYALSGGGDTASVILEHHVEDAFDFVSTGGGAMLDFLVEETLPAIEALRESRG